VEAILSRAGEIAFVRDCFRPWFTVWPRAELDRSLQNFSRTPSWALRAAFECALWTDITAEAAGISTPILAIAGEHDPVYGPAYQREAVLVTLLHAELQIVDCGHGLILELPEEIAEHCVRFFDSLP
jgi:pimeloyl-ACP methyl ester carboxylesterase